MCTVFRASVLPLSLSLYYFLFAIVAYCAKLRVFSSLQRLFFSLSTFLSIVNMLACSLALVIPPSSTKEGCLCVYVKSMSNQRECVIWTKMVKQNDQDKRMHKHIQTRRHLHMAQRNKIVNIVNRVRQAIVCAFQNKYMDKYKNCAQERDWKREKENE